MPARAQHSASIKAITARQLQALVRQRPSGIAGQGDVDHSSQYRDEDQSTDDSDKSIVPTPLPGDVGPDVSLENVQDQAQESLYRRAWGSGLGKGSVFPLRCLTDRA